MTTMVIIGGGLAGAATSKALRDEGFSGEVVLLGAEDDLPYERPPLSKDFLAGSKELPDFTVQDAQWYLDHHIDLRRRTRVSRIDAKEKTVVLPDGSLIHYDKLVLATGSEARRLGIKGEDAAGVHHLRSITDARALSDALTAGTRLAIVGGGWIGLEVAATARVRGVQVTIAEPSQLPLQRVMGTRIAEVFAGIHHEHGVDLRTGVHVTEITATDGTATGLLLSDGTTVDADTVLVAAGAVTDLTLAVSAGLDIGGGGVLVDAGLCSSNNDIYVVGDIANAHHPVIGHRVRVEHWANALNQPPVAAANMLGAQREYTSLPYFFTDQYDLGMEYVGLANGDDHVVVRGDLAGREFVSLWVSPEGRVRAGMQVNIWDQLDHIKALIGSQETVDLRRLADPELSLAHVH